MSVDVRALAQRRANRAGQHAVARYYTRWLARRTLAGMGLLLLLLAGGCGDAGSDAAPRDVGAGAATGDTGDAAATATALSIALTPIVERPFSLSGPTVTPGGIPPGYDGIIITGVISISGAATVAAEFRYPEYGEPGAVSCEQLVEGVSQEEAEAQTEAIFYEMQRYFILPRPHDPLYSWEAPNTPTPLGRIMLEVRIMPYSGPGTYDQSSGAFVRPTPKTHPADAVLPAIAFMLLPLIQVDGVSYDQLGPDATMQATINADGSGSLVFVNVRSIADPSGSGVSGEMTWNCANERGATPPP